MKSPICWSLGAILATACATGGKADGTDTGSGATDRDGSDDPGSSDTDNTDNTDDTDDTGDTDDVDPGDFSDGAYTLQITTTANDCGTQAVLPSGITATVSSTDSASYMLLLELVDENLALDCTLSATDFACTGQTVEDYADWGWAAVITFGHAMTGSWPSATSFEGTLVQEASCVGSECDGMADVLGTTFPCEVSHQLAASAQ